MCVCVVLFFCRPSGSTATMQINKCLLDVHIRNSISPHDDDTRRFYLFVAVVAGTLLPVVSLVYSRAVVKALCRR